MKTYTLKERPLTDKGARSAAEAILTPPFNRHGDWSRVPELAKWVLAKLKLTKK